MASTSGTDYKNIPVLRENGDTNAEIMADFNAE